MQIKKDYSYGIVPVRKNQVGEIEYLLIYQYSPVGDDHYWIFPKGHAEKEETPLESAVRELREETGLVAEIPNKTIFTLRYDFMAKDVQIDKEVHFFIGWITDISTLKLQAGEVSEAVWLPYDAARTRLSKENSRLVLDEIQTHLLTTNA